MWTRYSTGVLGQPEHYGGVSLLINNEHSHLNNVFCLSPLFLGAATYFVTVQRNGSLTVSVDMFLFVVDFIIISAAIFQYLASNVLHPIDECVVGDGRSHIIPSIGMNESRIPIKALCPSVTITFKLHKLFILASSRQPTSQGHSA